MDLKLVATDIDGTLLGPDHAVTERTIRSLRNAHEAGVEIVAATGRSHWSAAPLLEPVGCIRWLLASNGATLYDMESAEVVRRSPLDRQVVLDVISSLNEEFGEVGYSWETDQGVFQDETFRALRSIKFPSTKIAKRSTVEFEPGAEDLTKIMMFHRSMSDVEWFDAAAPFIPEGQSFSTSGTGFVELTSPEADKGVALAALCADLGNAQEDTIAFGDQANDLGMLRWVGKGYAMANASAVAKEAAPYEAPHHLEDGVAQVVDQLVRGSSVGVHEA